MSVLALISLRTLVVYRTTSDEEADLVQVLLCSRNNAPGVKRVMVPRFDGEMDHDVPPANAKAGIPGGKTPPRYRWHHGEDGKTMELVPKDRHDRAPHTGGRAAVPEQRGEVALGGDFNRPERTAGGLGAPGAFGIAAPGGTQ